MEDCKMCMVPQIQLDVNLSLIHIWAGATVPLTGFGHALAQGAIRAVQETGLLGAFTGGLTATAGGIAAAIFFGFLAALCFKPKPKT